MAAQFLVVLDKEVLISHADQDFLFNKWTY